MRFMDGGVPLVIGGFLTIEKQTESVGNAGGRSNRGGKNIFREDSSCHPTAPTF
jgi:hypothetical protein